MALETPSRPPPPFMANAILNFHFDFPHPSLITKPKQTECNVNSYNKDTEAFCKCECPDLIKQTGDEELYYSS